MHIVSTIVKAVSYSIGIDSTRCSWKICQHHTKQRWKFLGRQLLRFYRSVGLRLRQ